MLHPSCPDAAFVFCIEHFQNWDTTLRHKVSLEKCGIVCNLVSFQVQAFQSSAADKAYLLFVCHNWRLTEPCVLYCRTVAAILLACLSW